MKFQPFDPMHSGLIRLAAVALLALTALPAIAEEAAEPEKPRTVIKATMHIEVSEAEPVLGLLDVNFALKPDQNLIVLRGDSYEVETAIKVIDALDTPRPMIDLHVYVLAASKQGSANVPEGLVEAVDRLQSLFGYSGFQLLDRITLRVLEGRRGQAEGGFLLGEDKTRAGYHFGFDKVSVEPRDSFNNIRIKRLQFNVSGSLQAGLMTDVAIREGQKAVIGSSTPQGSEDTFVLIVEAKASPDPARQSE